MSRLAGGVPIVVQRDVLIGDETLPKGAIVTALKGRPEWRALGGLAAMEDVIRLVEAQVADFEDGGFFEDWSVVIKGLRFFAVGTDVFETRLEARDSLTKHDPTFATVTPEVSRALESWLIEHRAFKDWAEATAALPRPEPIPQDAAKFVKIGERQYTLVGTMHTSTAPDLSGAVPAQNLTNADLILEYPPLVEHAREYTAKDIAKVHDKTQTALAAQAPYRPTMTVIGADGRKLQIAPGEHMSLSIRNKRSDDFVIETVDIDAGAVRKEVAGYLSACTGKDDLPGVLMEPLGTWVGYRDKTDLQGVLGKTAERVRALSRDRDESTIALIHQHVLGVLDRNLATVAKDFPKDLPDYTAAQRTQARNSELVSAALDAVCNLLLFTQTLASRKPNVVVAFGDEHVRPLTALLEQVVRDLRAQEQKGDPAEQKREGD
ncbi:hypothetical protein [Occultella kanbiaonis]|uniref:hypothetical protein n=1 Tax=Occultella kanbiaonis TaxID=2675754 RepID=UPI0012B96FE1|nr:hypothetical protein [Occultella kanbiaonis]